MKLKLDLHPLFADGAKIEAALRAVIDEACDKRAAEVEIIPGKGSGALKKTVLRYLDRPDVKPRYHRLEKDSDNWGRLFVHFRWDRESSQRREPRGNGGAPRRAVAAECFCCGSELGLSLADGEEIGPGGLERLVECPSCGSPNRVRCWSDRRGALHARVEPGYEAA